MQRREDAFTALLIKPALFVLAVYVVAALLGVFLGAEGFFFATFVTAFVTAVVLPLYVRRELKGRRLPWSKPHWTTSRPL